MSEGDVAANVYHPEATGGAEMAVNAPDRDEAHGEKSRAE